MSGLSLGTLLSNFKSVALTVFELPVLAFTPKNLGGHVTPPRPFWEKFLGVMSGLFLGTSMLNFKSVALTFFELLEFNAKNLGVHVSMATSPFG